jgi:hypothetical protein
MHFEVQPNRIHNTKKQLLDGAVGSSRVPCQRKEPPVERRSIVCTGNEPIEDDLVTQKLSS